MSKYTSLLARGRTRGQIMSVIKSSSVSEASKKLDVILEKQAGASDSKLDIRRTTSDMAYGLMYAGLRTWYMSHNEKIPNMDDPSRDIYLSELWMREPILAGAVYSMTAKMAAMRWAVTGRRLKARNLARILAEAAHFDGFSWDGFIASTAQDFYTTNRGVFWETPREGDARYGKLADLGHIDALSCDLTGNKNYPVRYASELSGQTIRFRVGEYIHFTSMPSPRERRLGAGFCAVDRAFRAVRLLMAVHDYDDEKLRNLPPEGIASVSGLTMDEFMDAISLWKAQRLDDNSLTFPQVLWLIGSQPGSTVNVDIKGFSSLPESFDREQVVSHYISTLALDFGVDAREFWPISSGSLGTASESEIQHLKAKGKGPGEFISIVERQINAEADEDTQFGFDTADIEEDQNAAINAKAWIDAFYPLYTGTPAGKSKASPAGKQNTEMVPDDQEIPKDSAANEARGQFGQMGGQQGPEQIITKDQILRLLADKGVIPEWMMNDQRMRVEDTSIHISKELDDSEMTSFVFEKGVLKERRLPPIILNSSKKDDDVPYAEVSKGGPGSGFHGHAGRPGKRGGSSSVGRLVSYTSSSGKVQYGRVIEETEDGYQVQWYKRGDKNAELGSRISAFYPGAYGQAWADEADTGMPKVSEKPKTKNYSTYEVNGIPVFAVPGGSELPKELIASIDEEFGNKVIYNAETNTWHISSMDSMDGLQHGEFSYEALEGKTPNASEEIQARGAVTLTELLLYDFQSEADYLADGDPIKAKVMIKRMERTLREAQSNVFTINGIKPTISVEDFSSIAGEKSMKDVPNYRYAMGEHKCMNCRYFRRYPNKCELYDFKADEDYVCDDWESRGMGMKSGLDRSNGKDHTALTVVDGDKVVAVEHDEERVMAFLRQKELEIFEDKRNIRGDPIPAKEVKRGARITKNTVRDELERWKKHPILSQYVPSESEIKALLNEAEA